MAAKALRSYEVAGISAEFVSNVDPADMAATLDGLDAESTLFIIASKTFTTQETLTNAHARAGSSSNSMAMNPPWPSTLSLYLPTRKR